MVATALGGSAGGAEAALKRLRRDSLDAINAAQGLKRGRRADSQEGAPQPQQRQPDEGCALDGASTQELRRLGVELRGKVETHFLSEIVQLRGCMRAADEQMANTVRGESCVLCQSEFAGAHERSVAVRNICLTGDLLRRREMDVHTVLGSLRVGRAGTGRERDGNCESDARLDSPGSSADKTRCGYVRYFRSLRAAGMRFRACAVCGKNLDEDRMSKFLAGVDRLSYLAEQRFFDHAF